MTDPMKNTLQRSSSHIPSSSQARYSDSVSANSSVRPRNRRLISAGARSREPSPNQSSSFLSALSPSTSRASSPLPPISRSAGVSPNRSAAGGDLGQFLSESWTQSWSSVQGLFSGPRSDFGGGAGLLGPRSSSRQGQRGRKLSIKDSRKSAASWGPAPPSQAPGIGDVAAGSLADREAALKAARTASVLESHEGVNGGLDVSGKYKRRTSDEVLVERARDDDYLVYIHHVQPNDTYAGLILRYRCREDAFRRANGLWSRDSIQTRKWVTVPVDACEIRGRPCEPPSWLNSLTVDHLAATPGVEDENTGDETPRDGFFNGSVAVGINPMQEEETPWKHVRWVKMDGQQEPVEIGRVARGALGYFPPRRRRSFRTTSTLSTPRQSLDAISAGPGSADGPSPRRPSSLSSRPQFSGTPTSNRSRMGSDPEDPRPAWMRRPGGVGSMGRNVKTPGPDKDAFNTWTKKHIPGLTIEGPSMSVMGSETAKLGFAPDSGIAENSYTDGQEAITASHQGTGLDRAAAAVETWLRGALTKGSGGSVRGARGPPSAMNRDGVGDLIELTDTASDDGRASADPNIHAMDGQSLATSDAGSGNAGLRGRTKTTTRTTKGSKAE